jgi:hypothetical protein
VHLGRVAEIAGAVPATSGAADRLIGMANGPVQIPQAARLKLCRAAVQVIADQASVDMLHIKGDAVDGSLRDTVDPGSDVDVLVRPSHVARLHAHLVQHGWRVYSSFFFGSPFGHAQTYLHEQWGYLDLHRLFPGIERDPAEAFDVLWSERRPIDIATVAGAVPSVAAQRVILLLNSARNSRQAVVERLWTSSPAVERAATMALVHRLQADVGFAAATGDLDRHRSARSYPLWRVITRGGTRAEEWRARIRAAPTTRDRMLLILRAPAVNIEHLEHQLGRPPRPTDVARAFVARPALAVREWLGRKRARR